MIKLWREKKGSTTLLFALLFPLMCGIIGLAIDIGYLFYEKQKMQAACDLAALSSAQKITFEPLNVVPTAKEVANKNGVPNEQLTVNYPFLVDVNKVEVIATQKINFYFLQIIGIPNKTISTRAVAGVKYKTEVVTQEAALNYAIFSASSTSPMTMRGNGMNVTGNVHSNDNIRIMGNGHIIAGNVTAVNGVQKFATVVTGTLNGASPKVPIPSFNFDEYAAKATKVFNGDVQLQSMQIEGVWLVNGNLTINGGKVYGRGILLVTGDIRITGHGISYETTDALLALYSKKNIEISGVGSHVKGVLYAPTGQIKINGSNNTVTGALIGNEVIWGGNDIMVNANYDIRVPQSFIIQTDTISLFE